MRHLVRQAGRVIVLASIATTLVPATAYAAGPLAICSPGTPYRWPNDGTNIPWNPDQGPLGALSNAQGVALIDGAFDAWDAIASSSTTYAQGAPLPENVTVDNFFHYIFADAPDGLSAVVFDDTGEIVDLVFGPGSGVLGFAGPEWLVPGTCTILEGFAVINGGAIADVTDTEMALDIMVHEFGHYQNLAHTIVNGQIFNNGDTTGPTPFDTFPFGDLLAVLDEAYETMYPFYSGPGLTFAAPNKDDIVSLSTLYPAANFFSSTGTITGRILSSQGRTPKTGVNVIARNLANPFLDAVSAISGDYTDAVTPGAPYVGVYTLRGLTPGAEYAVYIDGIVEDRFSTPPAVLPGPEEFYNGQNEDNDSESDPPSEFVALSIGAGQRLQHIDIFFNRFRPNETLPLGDDSSLELALPFTFYMCGTRYDEVIVNANGSVSFGAPDRDFSETAPEFLAGPPRIAGAWDDFNPIAGGAVSFDESPWHFTITFDGVPEWTGPFSGVGSNTFSIRLNRFLSQIDIEYGGLTMRDGLAGVSCGGAITSGFESPTDLSSEADRLRINLLFQPAVYERFIAPTPNSPGSPNDLANLTLRFTPTTPFSDFWSEKNDTVKTATPISLPFDSIPVSRFTEIGREGDVDFYGFRATAGQIVVAEILSSQLDTVMGFFSRKTGEMLAVDDDSGPGVLSRIVIEIPEEGEYAVAVSTWPDFAFEGSEGGTGRYVLRVAAGSAATATSGR